MRKSEIVMFNVLVSFEVNGVVRVAYKSTPVDFADVKDVVLTSTGPRGYDLEEKYLGFVMNNGETLVTDISSDGLLIRLFSIPIIKAGIRNARLVEWLGKDKTKFLNENETKLTSGVIFKPIEQPLAKPTTSLPIKVEEKVDETIEEEIPTIEVQVKPNTQVEQPVEHIVKDKLHIFKYGGNRTVPVKEEPNTWPASRYNQIVVNPRYPESLCKMSKDGTKVTYLKHTRFKGILTEMSKGGEKIFWNELADSPRLASAMKLPFRSETRVFPNGVKKTFQYFYDDAGHEYYLSLDHDKTIVTKKFTNDLSNYYQFSGGLDYSKDLDYYVIRAC